MGKRRGGFFYDIDKLKTILFALSLSLPLLLHHQPPPFDEKGKLNFRSAAAFWSRAREIGGREREKMVFGLSLSLVLPQTVSTPSPLSPAHICFEGRSGVGAESLKSPPFDLAL